MAQVSTQNFANHVKYDPWFHFFLLPVSFINFIGAIHGVWKQPGLHTAWMLVLSFAFVIFLFKMRLYSLKVQTRVIRLEERLRLATILKDPLRGRIGELSEAQLVGLRFASDAECPGLVEQALSQNLTNKQIKEKVQSWRADEWRV